MLNIPWATSTFLLPIIAALIFSTNLYGQDFEDFETMSLDSLQSWLENNSSKDTSIFVAVAKMGIQKSGDDAKSLGTVYAHLASWYGYHGLFHPDSTTKYSAKSVEQYEKTQDTILIANALRTLAIDYVNNGYLEKSNVVLYKAVDFYEAIGDQVGLANVNRTISIVALFEENWETAIEYGEKAFPVFEREKDYYKMAVTRLNLIEAYRELKRYKSAHEAASSCIDLVDEFVPEEVFVLSRAYSQKAQTSHEEGNYRQALEEAQEAFDICTAAADKERCASYLQGVADARMALGDIDQALKHYLFILENEPINEANTKSIELYENVIECYRRIGDYKAVAKYQQVRFNLEEVRLNGVIKNLENESFAKYESGKKDQAIEVQQIQLTQKTRIQQLSYGIGALLLLLLAGLYFNYRKTKKISDQLKIKNDENELLLKEIHHRVKNNLEIVSGLLELQSAQIDDESIQRAMIDSQNRVQAMGILHQKLYQGINLDSIDMKDYFLNLSEGILDTFNADQKVTIDLVVQNLELDVDTAIPIGLIVNELLTNSLKYAFPNDGLGAISIDLKELDNDYLELQVKDSGIGINEDEQPKGTGFGSQLVALLTKQLDGQLTRNYDKGTVITLKFKRSRAA